MKRVALLLSAGIVLGSCTYIEGRTEAYRPPPEAASPHPESGRELYLRDCAWCHGNDATGTERGTDLTAGTNGPASFDFVLSSGRMPLDDPSQPMSRREPIYSREQMDELVEFSRSLDAKGPDVPDVDLTDASLQRGGVLYQENCAACHSTTGIGGALTQGQPVDVQGRASTGSLVAPPVTDASAIEVAEAIRVGPGTMPVFGRETFDDEDVNAIVSYVQYLKDPDDRGGVDIGRTGPVAEGAVGWIFGLGLLLVFCRWIGTKRGEP